MPSKPRFVIQKHAATSLHRGTYRNLKDVPMKEALERGHASFWLEGQKLRGGWTLRRIRGGEKPQWLLIKRRDEHADARRRPTSTQPESVLSGRTIEQVADAEGEAEQDAG